MVIARLGEDGNVPDDVWDGFFGLLGQAIARES